MELTVKKNIRVLTAALAVIGMLSFATATMAQTIYSSIPATLPGNVASLGFEATSASEAGDHVAFIPALPATKLTTVKVVMSSWGCQSGAWFSGDCMTTPGVTFMHPITLNIYAVAGTALVPAAGAGLATQTVTFSIPYRPSADPVNCVDHRSEMPPGANDLGKW